MIYHVLNQTNRFFAFVMPDLLISSRLSSLYTSSMQSLYTLHRVIEEYSPEVGAVSMVLVCIRLDPLNRGYWV